MNNPCYDRETKTDCPKRCAGCAGTCKKWADYVKARDEEYERRKNVNAANNIYSEGRARCKEKWVKHMKYDARGRR